MPFLSIGKPNRKSATQHQDHGTAENAVIPTVNSETPRLNTQAPQHPTRQQIKPLLSIQSSMQTVPLRQKPIPPSTPPFKLQRSNPKLRAAL